MSIELQQEKTNTSHSYPTIAQIVAISSNRCIGKDNDLPWHISEDLQHFKRMTTADSVGENGFKGIVVMGRKTFESMRSRPLPNRVNIIITRQSDYVPQQSSDKWAEWIEQGKIIVVNSLDEAIEVGKQQATKQGLDTLWVIGGEQIFRQALPITTRVELTQVNTVIENGDAFYPDLPSDFKQVSKSDTKIDEKTGFEFEFLTYLT